MSKEGRRSSLSNPAFTGWPVLPILNGGEREGFIFMRRGTAITLTVLLLGLVAAVALQLANR